MVETYLKRNCVNRAGADSEGPAHGRVNVRSGHCQTVIKLPDQESIRVATVNVGTLRGRASEVVETISRRNIDICCLQEVRWRGAGTRLITGKDTQYKLFWVGNKEGSSGVGVLIAEKWIDKVIHLNRVNDRLMLIKILIGKQLLTVVSAYAPQQALSDEAKESFYADLVLHTSKIDDKELIILGGDLNGHVGKTTSGYEDVHGGFGYGVRNAEGERILEFGLALDMVVCNTLFQKRSSRLITFSSGGSNTQIDYIMMKSRDKRFLKDVKVIPSEEVFSQHKLVVCDLSIRIKKEKTKPYIPKLKVWKLKDTEARKEFVSAVEERCLDNEAVGSVEECWGKLKNVLIEATEKVCGWTKGPAQRKTTFWWDAGVDHVIKEKRRLWKEWKKGSCSKERYTEAKRRARRAVYDAKTKAAVEQFGSLTTSKNCRDNAFRIARQMTNQNKDVIGDTCVKNDKGVLVFSDTEKLQAWKEHYKRLLNEEFPWDSSHLDMGSPKEGPAPWIDKQDVRIALKKMKNGKAAGVSGIVAEMLKASDEAGLELFTELFNNIVKEEKVPSDWEMSIIINCFKGKGDAVERGNFRGLKLLEHLMKVFERVMEKYIRDAVNINEMQFGFMPGRGTTDAIFITRQVQEKFLAKKKDLYFTFVDLEKAFDRVPRLVVKWALRKVGIEEWVIRVVMSMYDNAKSAVNINGTTGEGFNVKVGVHQGSVLSPLLFIIVLEALSREFRTGLPWELLYADDLVLIAESVEDLETKFDNWKTGMEQKGLRVNSGKTKVMICRHDQKPQHKSGKFPCGVCQKGVGRNSILCPKCKCWVHGKCSGIKGKLANATEFVCRKCLDGKPVAEDVEKVMLSGCNLEVMDRFCYLGDTLDACGGAESSTITRVRSGWKKFKELLPLLTTKATSLNIRGEIYATCVRSVMLYGSETWPVKVEDSQRLHRNEMSMIRWMCGVSLKDRFSCEELRARLGIKSILEVMRQRRLRWFGHVERRDIDSWLQKVRNLEIGGKRRPGRPCKTWEQVVSEDLRVKGIRRELAQNRPEWRSAIT